MIKNYLLLFALLLSTGLAHSQVTIGYAKKPLDGALLMLDDGTPSTNGENSSKGLGLPRVALKTLTPDIDELAESIGGVSANAPWDEEAHTGLVVYNVKDAVWDPATCKMTGAGPAGLYVWDGTTWQGIGVQAGGSTGTADPGEGERGGKLYDREGNDYHIGTFGAAGTWMTENLRTTKAPGMAAMQESAAASTIDMYYAYPMANGTYVSLASRPPGSWATREGILYNWAATMNRMTCATSNQGQGETTEQTDVVQGICPFGWHVPSDKEWNQLEQIISEDAASYADNYGTAGGAWPETSYPTGAANRGNHGMLLQSNSPISGTAGYSKPAGSGGFDLLLAGLASNGSAYNYGFYGNLWSSSSVNGSLTWGRYVYSGNADVNRSYNDRLALFSVRCKKD